MIPAANTSRNRTIHMKTPGVERSAVKLLRRGLVAAALLACTAACSGGLRPTLVGAAGPTPEPLLELDLPAAPEGTPPLPDGSADAAWQADVDDAIIAWARDRSIPYVDRCSLVTPGPNELCDVTTERTTLRLLGE